MCIADRAVLVDDVLHNYTSLQCIEYLGANVTKKNKVCNYFS